ncbi:UNVERIFIED_CONTAM: hypothetical protein GTU68_019495 [Idotea baltica]|nr:hypothetical protein [Idotea baltica]
MSYQVLARKWRPQNFKQMVGQEHVLRALMNALDSDRLHHAYLFTGTRGVGKTTIARILAKCLNCETGITSTPCGECNSCKEIVAGNFLDLIEVDAASRTKVEDTRELLENVQYAPTRARFKVYLIDEVHMLTGHSFNALLKTLEEPPPHVKFLFATTDPQKLPATILSRCLQFNLKRMPVDMISGHLEYLLKQESINFEESALRLIARAADGSMRDGLSLLDQAIAFSGSELTETSIRDMLGSISHEPLIHLLESILAGDGSKLLSQVDELSSVTPDFDAATDALISLLHQLAVQQVVPDAINDEENISQLAAKMTKEDVQLFYQIALQGRRDLPLSPDPRSGFEMLLLRMLSFRPLREGMTLEAPQQTSDSSKKKTLELNDSNVESITEDSSDIEVAKLLDSKPQENPKLVESPVNEINRTPQPTTQESVPPWEDIPPELEAGYSSKEDPINNTDDVKRTEKQSSNSDSKSLSLEDLLLSDDDVNHLDVDDEAETNESIAPQNKATSYDADSSLITDSTDQTKTDNNSAAPEKVDINQPWYKVVPQLNLSGRANELIKHCLLDSHENGIISLQLNKDSEDLLAETTKQEIQTALVNFYGDEIRLDLRIAEASITADTDNQIETPAQRAERKIIETQQQAEHNIETDPFVRELQSRFNAQIVPGSVKAKHIIK